MDYTKLITSEHRGKPKFEAMVTAVTSAFDAVGGVESSIISKFDLDTAVGVQLDVIGQWVGLTRNVPTPIAAYFSLDSTTLGFDLGSWKGPFDPSQGITSLDDETYRLVLRAKIGANSWDGTLPSFTQILLNVFVGTGTYVFAVDNQDMTMSVFLAGNYPSVVLQSLIASGYLALKPAGVGVAYYMVSVSGAPLFGFDITSPYIAGFDSGAWAKSL